MEKPIRPHRVWGYGMFIAGLVLLVLAIVGSLKGYHWYILPYASAVVVIVFGCKMANKK